MADDPKTTPSTTPSEKPPAVPAAAPSETSDTPAAAPAKPRITGITPSKAHAFDIVEIVGENFGEADEDGVDAPYSNEKEFEAMKAANASPTRRRAKTSITVNGTPITHVTGWSPTHIKVHLPAAPIQEGEITVTTPEGVASRHFEVLR